MRGTVFIGLMAATSLSASAIASPGPQPAPANPAVPAARDVAYPGVMTVAVDATDVQRRIVNIHETIPVTGGREIVLLYPEWTPGDHRPDAPIDRLAGLTITAGGEPVPWVRDTADVHAFRLKPPTGVKSLDLAFQYLSPVREAVGPIEISSNMALLEWTSLVLYPAGYFTRQIPVDASLTLPSGWSFATALEHDAADGGRTTFRRAPLETVVDSPIYAGVNFKTLDVTPSGGPTVRLNLVADRPENLEIKPAQIEQHRQLVEQAQKLYGSHHYDHYDFLLSLSDTVVQNGLEHHRSSEDGLGADYLTSLGQGARRARSAGPRVHPFLERQVPSAGRSLDRDLQHPDARQPAVGLRGSDGILGSRADRPGGLAQPGRGPGAPGHDRGPLPARRATRLAAPAGHHQQRDHHRTAARSPGTAAPATSTTTRKAS